jgi:hypothetical protein
MTSQDQQAKAASTQNGQPEFANPATGPLQGRDGPSSIAHVGRSPMESVAPNAEGQPSADELLFATDTSGLRSRWADIQAVFVDDPADCVEKADALVAEVVEQLTAAFAEARSRLEGQWARGEQASTEDLRLALQRYREFFERLLAV